LYQLKSNPLPTSNRQHSNPPLNRNGQISLYSTKNNFFNSGITISNNNYQDRIINFGQDSNENIFKKTLRKPLLTNSINIITGNPNPVYNYGYQKNFHSKFNNYNDKIEDIISNQIKLNGNSTAKQPFNPIRTPVSNFNSQRNVVPKNFLENNNNTNNINKNEIETRTVMTPRKENNTNTQFNNTFSNNSNKDKDNISNSYNLYKNNVGTNPDSNFESKSPNINNNYNRRETPNTNNFYNKQGINVKEYAYQEEQNSTYREYMEDRQKCVDNFMKDKNNSLFAIFDGHGGSKVADFAKEKIPEILEKLIKNSPLTNTENLLTTTFQKVDDELKYNDTEHVGSTATVVYITLEKNKRVLFCANVGDSRCVLISTTNAKRLSYDHKATDLSEMERVRRSGGIIFNGRVLGQLMLTRALGDFGLKKQGVVCTPSIQKHIITEKDKYIVIASDGVWDVINDEEVYKFSLRIDNADELAKVIIKNALFRGSLDNISCLVVKIN
jgi:serine/threonine protein phosphatase PrpC